MTDHQSNPFRDSAQEWQAMRDALHAAEEGRRHSDQLAIRLLAENEMLHADLAEANSERKFWMAYSVQIETRLDVISGVIQDARNEARALAKAHDEIHRERAETPPAPANRAPAPPQPVPRDRRPTLSDIAQQQEQVPDTEDEDSAVEIVQTIHKLANKWP